MTSWFHASNQRARRLAVVLVALLLTVPAGSGCGAADESNVRTPASGHAAPPAAVVPTPRSDDHTHNRRAAFRARVAQGPPVRIVLLGDSITEGWRREGQASFERELAPLGAANLGINGDRTEHLLGRLIDGDLEGIDPEWIVLLIGTNNLGRDGPRDVAAGVGAVVDWLHRARPNARILLLALLPRGHAPDGPERRVLRAANAELARVARACQSCLPT